MPGSDVGEQHEAPLFVARRGRVWAYPGPISQPSPYRADPQCAQAERCPGCPLRHLSADRQWQIKQASHQRALDRLGVEGPPIEQLGGCEPDGYRSRATARALPTSRDGEGERWVLGMGALRGAQPIDLSLCPAQTPQSRALLVVARAALAPLRPYDPETMSGDLLDVSVQAHSHGGAAGRVVVRVTSDEAAVYAADALGDRLEASCGLSIDVSRKASHGWTDRPHTRRGPQEAWFTADADTFVARPPSWMPQTPSTVSDLRRIVLDWLDVQPSDTVLEIGCGVGTLSIELARASAHFVGVDLSRQAVIDAQANCAAAGVAAHFRVGEAHHALRRLLAKGFKANRVVLHGMRAPFGDAVMRLLPLLGCERVVYLNPSAMSFARDLAACPLRPTRLGALEQLPGTAWLLSIAQLQPVRAR